MINIDVTLLFQIIGFFVLLVILNRFLYKPVQDILKERDEKIDGTLKRAGEIEKEVADSIRDYEKRLKDAALKGSEERNRLRQEGLDREKEVLEGARAQAARELQKLRKEIGESKASALGRLREESKTLSRDIAEKVLERKVVSLIFFLSLIFLPEAGFAQEEAHGESGSFWKILNFVILAVGVYLVWTRIIRVALDRRAADIHKAIEEARSAKEEADRKAAEFKEKLKLLEKRVSEIQHELRLEGESEKERIIKEAEEASRRISEQARLTAEQELKKAKMEIRKEVASIAVQMAEEILKKELKPEDQARLIKGYIDSLRLN